ncbi:MAG: hypothetical protein JXR36_06860 [Bacteroidales bacterium]|nr:hypothetical protein [Bacteroidales bacterium]
MDIKHLKHNQIDKDLWDKTILNSLNGTIYAMSWYLDCMSPKWEAIVTNNYEHVMPLPVKKKSGLKYLTQPYLSQQLGLFSQNIISSDLLETFLDFIPYRFYRLQLNSGNNHQTNNLKPNFILELQSSFEEISNNFSKNCNRNIKKAKEIEQTVFKDNDFDNFKTFTENNLNFTPPKGFLSALNTLLQRIKNEHFAEIWSVNDEQTNQIIASVLILRWKNRIYYLMPSSSELGKQNFAMYLILAEIIRQNSNTPTILDFEGSSIEGVARFYKGFGAIPEYYPILNKNKLLFPLNKIVK